MAVRVGRQIRIDEDIVGYGDEQLLSLVWMGLQCLPRAKSIGAGAQLLRRLEMFRSEVERRGLLSDEMMEKFAAKLARR